MIKDLLSTELRDLPIEGLDIHIIKKYVVKTSSSESFKVKNLSILLIRSGRLKIKLREIVQDLSACDLLIIPKDSFCTLLETQEKLQLFLITFSSEFAVKHCIKKELVGAFYLSIRREPMKVTLEEKEFFVLSLIYKLIYFVKKGDVRESFDGELKRITINLFLYELKLIHTKYSSGSMLNFTRKENLVIDFLTILSIHYKKQHNVKFYAGTLFVTSGYLNKIVKQIMDKTVKKIIIEIILLEAENLLDDPKLTIAEIAEEFEFTTANSFSIFFKKHTSFSPSQYRLNAIDKF